jgi:hypothetical protein
MSEKTIVQVSPEVQDAFSKDLDALCEKYNVKIMPTMFIVQEIDTPVEQAPVEPAVEEVSTTE